jgi:hypothetical protein
MYFAQELLYEVFSYLSPQPDLQTLLSCTHVNRAFLSASRLALFTELCLSSEVTLYGFMERNTRNERVLNYFLELLDGAPVIGAMVHRMYLHIDASEQFNDVFALLSKLSMLKSLILFGNPSLAVRLTEQLVSDSTEEETPLIEELTISVIRLVPHTPRGRNVLKQRTYIFASNWEPLMLKEMGIEVYEPPASLTDMQCRHESRLSACIRRVTLGPMAPMPRFDSKDCPRRYMVKGITVSEFCLQSTANRLLYNTALALLSLPEDSLELLDLILVSSSLASQGMHSSTLIASRSLSHIEQLVLDLLKLVNLKMLRLECLEIGAATTSMSNTIILLQHLLPKAQQLEELYIEYHIPLLDTQVESNHLAVAAQWDTFDAFESFMVSSQVTSLRKARICFTYDASHNSEVDIAIQDQHAKVVFPKLHALGMLEHAVVRKPQKDYPTRLFSFISLKLDAEDVDVRSPKRIEGLLRCAIINEFEAHV